jgi:hypothetical protein
MSTKAGSSTRSGANRRRPRRPSKLALLRIKVVTIIGAIVLFIAGVAGIAIYNPGVASQNSGSANPAPTSVPAQHISILTPGGGSTPKVVQPPTRTSPIQPFVRSRGS